MKKPGFEKKRVRPGRAARAVAVATALIAGGLWALCWSGVVLAQRSDLPLAIDSLQGSVSIVSSGDARPAKPGEKLAAGSIITAGKDGVAGIAIAGWGRVRILPGSRIEVREASEEAVVGTKSETRCLRVSLDIQSGRAYFDIATEVAGFVDFRVSSGGTLVTARGTAFSVAVGPQHQAIVSVGRGGVSVASAGSTVFVPASYQSVVSTGGQPSPPMILSENEEDMWATVQNWLEVKS